MFVATDCPKTSLLCVIVWVKIKGRGIVCEYFVGTVHFDRTVPVTCSHMLSIIVDCNVTGDTIKCFMSQCNGVTTHGETVWLLEKETVQYRAGFVGGRPGNGENDETYICDMFVVKTTTVVCSCNYYTTQTVCVLWRCNC